MSDDDESDGDEITAEDLERANELIDNFSSDMPHKGSISFSGEVTEVEWTVGPPDTPEFGIDGVESLPDEEFEPWPPKETVADPLSSSDLIDGVESEAMRESLGVADKEPAPTARQIRQIREAQFPETMEIDIFDGGVAEKHHTDSTAASSDTDDTTITTTSIEVDGEMVDELLEVIANRVEKRERQGFEITQLVVGVPQYKALLAWSEEHHAALPVDALPVDDLIVVPVPIIHPVIPPRPLLTEVENNE